MSLADVLLLALLAVTLLGAARRTGRMYKEGRGCGYGCTGSCEGCKRGKAVK